MTDTWTKKFSERGFTFLEIIICLALIATVLLAIFRLQAKNLDLQSEAQFITTAQFLSQERLAKLRSGGDLLPGSATGDFGEDFPLYGYDEEISAVPNMEDLLKVSIRITLTGGERVLDYDIVSYFFRARR